MPKDKYANKRLHIFFTDVEVLNRLKRFALVNFGQHNATSMIVEKAIRDYLDRKGG